MTPLNQVSDIMVFAKKIFTHQNGSLVILATPVSDFIITAIKEIFIGVATKDYALPFVVAAVCLMLYFTVFVMDFITGLRASRFEAENKSNYIKSEKLWSSIWKISVIFLMVFLLTIFSVIFAVLELEIFQSIFTYSIAIIAIMASLFDIHSIGENHQRRFGKKPTIFAFLDNASNAINEGIMKKLKGLF